MKLRTAILIGLRLTAGVWAIRQLSGAARQAPPITKANLYRQADLDSVRSAQVTVLIPARDEAARIGPALAAMVGAPGVAEVIVIDDNSTDATAEIAITAGAKVVSAPPLPPGWAGKAWALHQGLIEAKTTWVVTLDADTYPDPHLPAALTQRAEEEGYVLMTVGGRFDCPSPGARWLHPAFLTTLVYRFGPPGVSGVPADRLMANGQCMVARREVWEAEGFMGPVAEELVEDVALARHLARRGHRVGFLDAAELLTVRMYEDAADTWRGWGRSIALPGVEKPLQQWRDLAVVLLAQVLPLPRLLTGRGDVLDAGLLALRIGTLFGTRRAYTNSQDLRDRLAYWGSPLADPVAAAAILRGIMRPRQVWRGRDYSGLPSQNADR
jgi:dolichol-phosphate mannosyltransferase